MQQRCTAFLAFLFAAVLQAQASEPPGADAQLDELLAKARGEAAMLKSDLATLDFFISGTGLESHARMMDLYGERAIRLRALAEQIIQVSKSSSHWRQFSAERTAPLVQELAATAETTLKACRATSSNRPGLAAYLRARSDLADELYRLISAWIDYGKTKEQADRTATELEVSGASSF